VHASKSGYQEIIVLCFFRNLKLVHFTLGGIAQASRTLHICQLAVARAMDSSRIVSAAIRHDVDNLAIALVRKRHALPSSHVDRFEGFCAEYIVRQKV